MAASEAGGSDWHTINLSIPFATAPACSTALRVLSIDRPLRSETLKRVLSISPSSPNTLNVEFRSLTLRQARVAIDHFLADLKLVAETMTEFGPEEFGGTKNGEKEEADKSVEVGLKGSFDGTNIR
ncbi:Pcc1-domain-containing protein [Atractiella rhizophila]|nr:Pcc1-domain-containing protein [Atractiella rhizophila]